jgi:hypothetical protein
MEPITSKHSGMKNKVGFIKATMIYCYHDKNGILVHKFTITSNRYE